MKLGIDLGGSKIRFAVVQDNTINSINFDYPANPTSSKDLSKRLYEAVSTLNILQFDLIAVGMAGGLQEGFKKIVFDALRDFSTQIFIFSDLQVVHFSFFENSDGVVVISGTGSSIFGKLANKSLFYGGLGFAISDVGSGFDIGKSYLSKGLSQMQLGKNSKETKLIEDYFKEVNVNTIIEKIYSGNVVKNIADFSAFVLKKDPQNPVVRKSSISLARETLKAIFKLGFESNVRIGLSGGVFEYSVYFRQTFLNILGKRINVELAERKMPNEVAVLEMAHLEEEHV
ncbi:BadF/BadG/BcrA/BcrD ATPase family protein [Caldisericum exile]|uniref:ATPase BadF/BadG/BcrA/BcrD type domain-containing protein n=1 Tax=Caldisericum exile (strain DSM 21853 / NBRC 104410 / AZM16c01) TaxID=511051 RepID=A0A7U6JFP8_CALEA|nr:BadF/BadG/BcrA/BcrD ATPase family protein [Caldisericum exile]BAL80420.1 hypothetical protein CSE_02940 [Caldisericum exile AZM16c01]